MTLALTRGFDEPSGPPQAACPVTLRSAEPADAPAIHALVCANLRSGHLLPRTLSEIAAHVRRFIVVCDDEEVLGAGELAPLSSVLAEVRSLVVAERWRGAGIGSLLVRELQRRARIGAYATLCSFTHQPAYFVRLGFSIVPHTWLPEKIALDCVGCPLFRQCGQYAMVCAVRALALPEEGLPGGTDVANEATDRHAPPAGFPA